MKSRVTLNGAEFKDLALKITRFPGLGMFGGSDLVHLSASDGWFKAASSGVVLAIGRKRCEETLPLCAIDERILVNFAGITPESGTVKIEVVDKQLRMRCGKNEVLTQMIAGKNYKGPEVGDLPKLKISGDAAERIRYLADIAYNDVTRPELCCVMLGKTGAAYAMDQKAVAVLNTEIRPGVSTPLPLPFARAIEAGNNLYVGSKVTILKAGWVSYSMPTLTAAKKYPFGLIKTHLEGSKAPLGEVNGELLSGAIDDCVKCLGQLARTEMAALLHLNEDGTLFLGGDNSGTKFETSVKAKIKTDAVFRIPLASLSRVRPFLRGAVTVSGGNNGDMYLTMKAGWAMFPGQPEEK